MSRISVALGTFNGALYLEEQLNSFLCQKRLPDELVVCDDASTDNTPAILKQFAEQAPFEVRININTFNLGVTRNFEKAISLCTGDYIFLSDQDDIWLPDKIMELSEYLEKRPECGLVFCNALVVDKKLEPTGSDLWESFWFTPREQKKTNQGKLIEVLLKHNVAAGMAMAFRSEFRSLLLPFPEVFSCHDAWPALVISAVSEAGFVDRKLIHYRIHDSNHQLIGIRRLKLLDQLKVAQEQMKNSTFSELLTLYQALEKRLSSSMKDNRCRLKNNVLGLLRGKIEHTQNRIRLQQLPKFKLNRLGLIAKEIASGGYFKFSYGIKSLAQDLFL